MNVRACLVSILVLILLMSTTSGALAAPGDDDLCPPLEPPTGNIVEVATVGELQNAVNTAAAGDTILIADGTYSLDGVYLRIDEPNVTLRSASGNRESVVLDGDYITTEIIQIVASDVTVADLTLREAYNHPIHVMSTDSGHTLNTLIHNVHIIDPGQHMQPDTPVASHAWVNVDLANPGFQGPWFVGEQRLDSVNGYLFSIPAGWAEAHTGGRPLATGRYRDGGWSGMGPALFAYRPWDENGAPAPPGARLAETVLLRYASSEETDAIERCLKGYQHPDEWEGGAWITTPSGKSAVLFAGTKGTGALYWYGYVNPAGPEQPCVDADLVGTFDVCRQADGTPCPDADLTECAGHNDYRGWWSSRFEAQFLLYDPAVLAQVAAGTLEPWQPQPYAVVRIDEHLFLAPPEEERAMLGTGVQRRMRVGPAAYDRASGLLYIAEPFGDGDKPVVHVWQVE